ncbi:hypothetical protein MP228_001075 [Amoeboaphelidium protococcarum]|nr:hypothetical protein MP228_001075 [Amoeboaphelidium protococcarum]
MTIRNLNIKSLVNFAKQSNNEQGFRCLFIALVLEYIQREQTRSDGNDDAGTSHNLLVEFCTELSHVVLPVLNDVQLCNEILQQSQQELPSLSEPLYEGFLLKLIAFQDVKLLQVLLEFFLSTDLPACLYGLQLCGRNDCINAQLFHLSPQLRPYLQQSVPLQLKLLECSLILESQNSLESIQYLIERDLWLIDTYLMVEMLLNSLCDPALFKLISQVISMLGALNLHIDGEQCVEILDIVLEQEFPPQNLCDHLVYSIAIQKVNLDINQVKRFTSFCKDASVLQKFVEAYYYDILVINSNTVTGQKRKRPDLSMSLIACILSFCNDDEKSQWEEQLQDGLMEQVDQMKLHDLDAICFILLKSDVNISDKLTEVLYLKISHLISMCTTESHQYATLFLALLGSKAMIQNALSDHVPAEVRLIFINHLKKRFHVDYSDYKAESEYVLCALAGSLSFKIREQDSILWQCAVCDGDGDNIQLLALSETQKLQIISSCQHELFQRSLKHWAEWTVEDLLKIASSSVQNGKAHHRFILKALATISLRSAGPAVTGAVELCKSQPSSEKTLLLYRFFQNLNLGQVLNQSDWIQWLASFGTINSVDDCLLMSAFDTLSSNYDQLLMALPPVFVKMLTAREDNEMAIRYFLDAFLYHHQLDERALNMPFLCAQLVFMRHGNSLNKLVAIMSRGSVVQFLGAYMPDILAYIFTRVQDDSRQKALRFFEECINSSTSETQISLSDIVRPYFQQMVSRICWYLCDQDAVVAAAALDQLKAVVHMVAPNVTDYTIKLTECLLALIFHLAVSVVQNQHVSRQCKLQSISSFAKFLRLLAGKIDTYSLQLFNLVDQCKKHGFDTSSIWESLIDGFSCDLCRENVCQLLCGYLNLPLGTDGRLSPGQKTYLDLLFNKASIQSSKTGSYIVQNVMKLRGEYGELTSNFSNDGTLYDDVFSIIDAQHKNVTATVLQLLSREVVSMNLVRYVDTTELASRLVHLTKKFRWSDDDLVVNSILRHAISMLNVLDYRQNVQALETSKSQNFIQVHILADQENAKQVVRYIMTIITSFLIPPLTSARDSKTNDRYSFVIQELLSATGFKNIQQIQSPSNTSIISHVWRSLSHKESEILLPLLSSQYHMQLSSTQVDLSEYVLESVKSYADFVRVMVNTLINILTSSLLRRIFWPFKALFTAHFVDAEIALALLSNLARCVMTQGVAYVNFLTVHYKRFCGAKPSPMSADDYAKCLKMLFYVYDQIVGFSFSSMFSVKNGELDQCIVNFMNGVDDSLIVSASKQYNDYYRLQRHSEKLLQGKLQPDLVLLNNLLSAQQNLGSSDDVLYLIQKCRENHSAIRGRSDVSQMIMCYTAQQDVQLISQIANSCHSELKQPDIIRLRLAAEDYEGVSKIQDDDVSDFVVEAAAHLQKWDLGEDKFQHNQANNERFQLRGHFIRLLSLFKIGHQEKLYQQLQLNDFNVSNSLFKCKKEETPLVLFESRVLSRLQKLIKAESVDWNQCFDEDMLYLSHHGIDTLTKLESLKLWQLCARNLSLDRELQSSICIQKCKLLRKAYLPQVALKSVLSIDAQMQNSGLLLEFAKVHVAVGKPDIAINELRQCIAPKLSQITTQKGSQPNDPFGSLCMYQTKLMLQYYPENSSEIRSLLAAAKKCLPKSEKLLHTFGSYELSLLSASKDRFERALTDFPKGKSLKSQDSEIHQYFHRMVANMFTATRAYCLAAIYGSQHIFESLPNAIQLWLDFTEKQQVFLGINDAISKTYHEFYDQFLTTMISFVQRVPAYNLLVSLSQIQSRLTHSDEKVWGILRDMLLKLLREFPDQTLWQLISSYKSSSKLRVSRVQEVFNSSKEQSTKIKNCKSLVDLIFVMAYSKKFDSKSKFSIAKEFPELKKLCPIDLAIPIQSALTPLLPPKNFSGSNWRPFQDNLAYFDSFEDVVELLNSLMRPRKLKVRGSDGNHHTLLCKPGDDLRKDHRVIELFGVINSLFGKDSDCTQRDLGILTYAAIPLSESCGLIEWVDNTCTFRKALEHYYSKNQRSDLSASKYTKWKELGKGATALTKYYKETLLPMFSPAVFQQWLFERFVDPPSWYRAQKRWTRSVAVMSIVGFIFGLGDRHLENILVQETSGQVLHVDFNCLFDKGLLLEYPERVPFRLSQNVVAGFGFCGVNGTFSKSCELTIQMLRKHKETILTMLSTFVHDPLIEWSSSSSSRKDKAQQLTDNHYMMANRVVGTIQRKLNGYLGLLYEYQEAEKVHNSAHIKAVVAYTGGKSASSSSSSTSAASSNKSHTLSDDQFPYKYDVKALSSQQQVKELISMATEEVNLARMWIGWNAFM